MSQLSKPSVSGSCEVVRKAIPYLVEGSLEKMMEGAVREHTARCDACGERLREELEWNSFFSVKRRALELGARQMVSDDQIEEALSRLVERGIDIPAETLDVTAGNERPIHCEFSRGTLEPGLDDLILPALKALLAVSFAILLIFGNSILGAVIPAGTVAGIGGGIFGAVTDELQGISSAFGVILTVLGGVVPLLGLYVLLGFGAAITIGKPGDDKAR